LIIGMRDGALLYHDPTYPDQRGAGRVLPNQALLRAWAGGPAPSQAAAFGIGKAELGLFATVEDLVAAQQPPEPPAPVRDVPTPSARERMSPLAQLIPVSDEPIETTVESGPWWNMQIHPLLLGFWLVAFVILAKVVLRFVFD
jgi:hypothetical protein